MMYPPLPVEMTEAPGRSLATTLSTWAWPGLLTKLTVNSVPPAKSIPSLNPLWTMKKMPGMMISSENRKYQLRRLTKSIFLTRGGGGGVSTSAAATRASAVRPGFSSAGSASGSSSCSSSSSSGASVPSLPTRLTSDGSDTIHPHQCRTTERAAGHDNRKQVVRDDDRRDEAGDDTDNQRDREALDGARPDETKDETSDDRRKVRVTNRRPCPPHGRIHRRRSGSACAFFFLETFKDQRVGIDRHTDRQDESGDACQRQCDRHELEDRKNRARVKEQRKAREEAR